MVILAALLLRLPLLLAAYLHRLDPFFIEFPDWDWLPVDGIRWYGLSYLLGFYIGYLLIRRITRVGVTTLKPEAVGDYVVAVAIGVVLGGRLGYVLFYNRELLWDFSPGFPYWGVLALNKGGMASHGGIIGGIVACWYYARRHGHSWPHLLDFFGFGAPLGLFFGRIANFINGELYGRPVRPGSPAMAWAVKFPQEMYQWPADRIDSVLGAVPPEALGITPGQMQRALAEEPGWLIGRTIDAIQAGQQQVIALIDPALTPRHPSQLYEALLEGLVVFLVLLALWARPRKPLIIGATFAIVYSLMRIIGEQFRVPDEHIADEEFARWGVTRGQLLSVALLAVGVVLFAIFFRRAGPAMGGWLAARTDDQAPPAQEKAATPANPE